eukprot:TRINITY_DN36523_c0_g1_i4.p3 TRINITY_DN36523_c0_g1~~TRINITY_DN36523_c0_g1_i4.p3  ORF type:complete len:122 (-),score=15.94 TRINITY_DN36523_c0_g1_i4:55-420(-)
MGSTRRSKQSSQRRRSREEHNAFVRWRRVASTHKLQDLYEEPFGGTDDAPDAWAFYGGLLMLLSVLLLSVGTFLFAPAIVNADFAAGALGFAAQVSLSLLPTAVFFLGVNWFCIKLFKHNT